MDENYDVPEGGGGPEEGAYDDDQMEMQQQHQQEEEENVAQHQQQSHQQDGAQQSHNHHQQPAQQQHHSNQAPSQPQPQTPWMQAYQTKVKEMTYDKNLKTTHMRPYLPLADQHLQDYFGSPHTRRHLVKLGLIEQDGTILTEKQFKKTQILLDKRRVAGVKVDREMERDIEMSIRSKSLKESKKVLKLKAPGQGNHHPMAQEFLHRYPISMQTTASIYTAKDGIPGDTSLHSSSGHSTHPHNNAVASAKKLQNQQQQMLSHPPPATTSRSLVELFDLAKQEYERGQVKEAQENLRSILKATSAIHGQGKRMVGGPAVILLQQATRSQQQSAQPRKIPRPKSARPTRNSAFPVSTAFSEDGGEEDLQTLDVSSDVGEQQEEEEAQVVEVDESEYVVAEVSAPSSVKIINGPGEGRGAGRKIVRAQTKGVVTTPAKNARPKTAAPKSQGRKPSTQNNSVTIEVETVEIQLLDADTQVEAEAHKKAPSSNQSSRGDIKKSSDAISTPHKTISNVQLEVNMSQKDLHSSSKSNSKVKLDSKQSSNVDVKASHHELVPSKTNSKAKLDSKNSSATDIKSAKGSQKNLVSNSSRTPSKNDIQVLTSIYGGGEKVSSSHKLDPPITHSANTEVHSKYNVGEIESHAERVGILHAHSSVEEHPHQHSHIKFEEGAAEHTHHVAHEEDAPSHPIHVPENHDVTHHHKEDHKAEIHEESHQDQHQHNAHINHASAHSSAAEVGTPIHNEGEQQVIGEKAGIMSSFKNLFANNKKSESSSSLKKEGSASQIAKPVPIESAGKSSSEMTGSQSELVESIISQATKEHRQRSSPLNREVERDSSSASASNLSSKGRNSEASKSKGHGSASNLATKGSSTNVDKAVHIPSNAQGSAGNIEKHNDHLAEKGKHGSSVIVDKAHSSPLATHVAAKPKSDHITRLAESHNAQSSSSMTHSQTELVESIIHQATQEHKENHRHNHQAKETSGHHHEVDAVKHAHGITEKSAHGITEKSAHGSNSNLENSKHSSSNVAPGKSSSTHNVHHVKHPELLSGPKSNHNSAANLDKSKTPAGSAVNVVAEAHPSPKAAANNKKVKSNSNLIKKEESLPDLSGSQAELVNGIIRQATIEHHEESEKAIKMVIHQHQEAEVTVAAPAPEIRVDDSSAPHEDGNEKPVKDITKVLHLNDSTVGRSKSVRGSMGKKVMRVVSEGEDDSAGEPAFIVPRASVRRSASKRASEQAKELQQQEKEHQQQLQSYPSPTLA